MTHQQQTAFENIVGKGKNSCFEQFLLFPQYFLLNQIIVSPFVHIFDIISLFAAENEEPKTGISGNGLNGHKQDKYQQTDGQIMDNKKKIPDKSQCTFMFFEMSTVISAI